MDLINNRLMTEAATLLDNSAMQTAEIADLLGFKDPSYFSRFFRRHAGKSPRDFRASKMRKQEDGNYSAWP